MCFFVSGKQEINSLFRSTALKVPDCIIAAGEVPLFRNSMIWHKKLNQTGKKKVRTRNDEIQPVFSIDELDKIEYNYLLVCSINRNDSAELIHINCIFNNSKRVMFVTR